MGVCGPCVGKSDLGRQSRNYPIDCSTDCVVLAVVSRVSRVRVAILICWLAAAVYNLPRFFERSTVTQTSPTTSNSSSGSAAAAALVSRTALRENAIYIIVYKTALSFFSAFFSLSAGPFVRSAFDNAPLNGGLRLDMFARLLASFLTYLFTRRRCLQCFDAVGWAAGMASGL